MSLKPGGEVIGSETSFSDDIELPMTDQREEGRGSNLPLFFLS